MEKEPKLFDELKKDYADHGYNVVSEEPGKIIFETTKKDYMKKVKPEIHETHPIFTDEFGKQEGTKSTVIVHNMCGHCRLHLNYDTCAKCNRTYRIKNRKHHIPYPNEIGKKGGNA